MIVTIEDEDLKELIETGYNSKYKIYARDKKFMEAIAKIYKIMKNVANANGLKVYSFLHYEKLKNNAYLSSVRVLNRRVERLLFREYEGGISIVIIDLDNDHYGNKK